MKNQKPPKLASKLLLSFLREDLAEDVSGDLEERFYNNLRDKSAFRSRLQYWYEVIHYLRPFAFKKSTSYPSNHSAMIKSYLKTGWRSLIRQKMYSFIKIGGFALGIAACLLISLYINDELSFDKFYKNGKNIYRVYEISTEEGDLEKYVWFEAPFARALKEDYPEIEKAGRYNSSELFGAGANQIRRDDETENTYEERFVYADQELIEILEVPMVFGSLEHCLDQPQSMVITRSKAEKYFGKENPVGKLMVVNDDIQHPYSIGGVIEDFSHHSHIQFDFIITMTEREFWPGEQNFWGATNYPTYVQLREGADAKALEAKLKKVVTKYKLPMWLEHGRSNAKERAELVSYGLQPVRDIHLTTDISDPLSHGDGGFVWIFGVVAAFILFIAGINFINLSTAKSANRAKEVGLRKTVGSYRSNIIGQFLTESLIFSLFSFITGILTAIVLLPFFNELAGKNLTIPLTSWWFIPLMAISCLFIGVVAGIYPAFYLSSFRPVQVLKGNLSLGSKNSFTRSALVVFQFTTSIALIICTVVIYRQMEFLLNKKVGFDRDQVIMLQGTNTIGDKLETMKEEMLNISGVKFITISDYLPIAGTKRNGNGFWNEGRNKIDKSIGAQFWVVDEDYIKTMGIKLLDGRDFAKDRVSDTISVIINQSMAKELGLQDPIGKRIQNWRPWNVIGIVEDFNYESLRDEIFPLAMRVGVSPGIVSVKVSTADIGGTLEQIEKVWEKFSPNQKIRYIFMDDSYARMYADVQRMGKIFTTFAVFAIFVACLGLFALSAFMVEQRNKEVSIRLVLGASLRSIFSLLTVNFMRLVLIAIVIAAPIGYYAMHTWLEDFEYKTPISWDIFILAAVLALLIALITISYQSLRAGLVKPINGLRSE